MVDAICRDYFTKYCYIEHPEEPIIPRHDKLYLTDIGRARSPEKY